MTGWLLDTNVLSELRRPRPSPKVVAFITAQPLDILEADFRPLARKLEADDEPAVTFQVAGEEAQ